MLTTGTTLYTSPHGVDNFITPGQERCWEKGSVVVSCCARIMMAECQCVESSYQTFTTPKTNGQRNGWTYVSSLSLLSPPSRVLEV